MDLCYHLHINWDPLVTFFTKRNYQIGCFCGKNIHELAKYLCKNDTSKMEPEQSKGYVSFILSKIDPNGIHSSKNEGFNFLLALNKKLLLYKNL